MLIPADADLSWMMCAHSSSFSIAARMPDMLRASSLDQSS